MLSPSPKILNKQKVLLLDFDGVILKHKPVLKRIQNRVVDYVRENVHQGYLSMEDAQRLNRDLYTRYGHSHLGMKKLFLPFSRLSSFNDYVYQPAFLQGLYHEYMTDEILQNDIQSFKGWMASFEDKTGVPTYIFTNSPSHWCEMWLMSDKNTTHVKGIRDILGSNHSVFETPADALLKPNQVLYRRMESYLSSQFNSVENHLIFVDDSVSNLEPIVTRSMWTPIWFGNTLSTNTNERIRCIQGLNELDSILV